MARLAQPARPGPVAVWLLVCCALIFAMVVLGGVTRLTRSGLSIVEWNPVMGAIPPLTEHQWEAEFEKYRQTPEYLKVNYGMSLAAFKQIYWVEFAHRLLGRAIGFVFLVPFLYFLVRKRIGRELAPKLVTLFVLGGLQGALGWYMVASGLVDDPHVSAYRLTAHLGLAVVIYGYMFWVALGLMYPEGRPTPPGVRRFAWAVTGLVFVTILAGGFVAGTRAGFLFNTWPLMNGRLVPEGLYALHPWWLNWFENVATVQFNHRWLAYAVVLATVALWIAVARAAPAARARTAAHLLLAAVLLQFGLGIATLLTIVPVSLGAAHQGGALLVLTAALFLNHALRKAQF
ncbi:heme A synthase [Sulfurifustis variabilis]|uniref:Heme A synthase n=1 Tax=Sulfurifustis variabilis TaxID=1675686 RepID=A0A1B4V2X4_9GAMM|nr:COX15/CtaA family protein [Sulfurifustis variabilis]BAU46822.1 heme A synthase [Sulfurifustis variabilis]